MLKCKNVKIVNIKKTLHKYTKKISPSFVIAFLLPEIIKCFTYKHMRQEFEYRRSFWMDNREEVMKTAMTAKFNQHELFRKALINTGDRKLVEASIDKFWGCGRRLDDPEIIMPKKQIAKNPRTFMVKYWSLSGDI